MILLDGRTRAAWSSFHGKSEAAQLQALGDGFGFTVRPNDVYSSGERAELMVSNAKLPLVKGQEIWCGWETTFPDDFLVQPESTWNIATQFHHTGPTGSPSVDLSVDARNGGELLRMVVRGGDVAAPVKTEFPIAQIQRSKPYKLVARIRWSPDDLGVFEAWCDGERVAPLGDVPTLYLGQGVYLKQGFYRGPWDQQTRVIHRKTVVADRLQDVRGILG